MSERVCSRGRSLLVLKWMVLGFLLTISYKSVLRSMMMTVEYENAIETADDVLQSDRKFMAARDSSQKFLLESDPRLDGKKLASKVEYYTLGQRVPEWLIEG